jgi:hypothetical protein
VLMAEGVETLSMVSALTGIGVLEEMLTGPR